MASDTPWRVQPAGDRCVVLEFGSTIERSLVNRVIALNAAVTDAVHTRQITGIVETIPTFRSLAVIFDPLQTNSKDVVENISSLDCTAEETIKHPGKHWNIPIHYGGEHGPDLEQVAQLTSLSADQVIALHLGTSFTVYMLGFLPGFAFLGDTPDAIHLPRRTEPRVRVPAGSVAIANQLTGVYPWESPGGWHILGHSPVPFFESRLDPPALLRAGDVVSFRAMGLEEHSKISASVKKGRFERSSLEDSSSKL